MKNLKLKNILFSFIASILCVSFMGTSAVQATNAGLVGSWNASTSLPSAKSSSGSAVYNGRVYVVGGWQGSGGTNTVNYATLNSNGTVGSWTTSPNTLPQNVRVNDIAVYNGYLYSVGGLDDSTNRFNSVSYAHINSDGTVGTWSTSGNTLPTTIQQSATFAYNGYLYVIGGYNGSAQSAIYYAPLSSDGSVGAWATNSTSLPSARQDTQPAVYNGRVYIIGGRQPSTAASNSVFYASINSDHTIGSWSTSSNSLPDVRTGASVVEANGYLYVMGGLVITSPQTTVYQTQIKSSGDTGAWTTSSSSLAAARNNAFGFTYNNYLYMTGGQNSSNNPASETYYAPVTAPTTSATVTNPVTSKPIVISTPAGTDLTCSSASGESSLAVADSSYDYPVGLASFCYTTNAPSNQVTVTFVTNLDPTKVVLRHFNSTTNTYSTVSSATFTATTYGGEPAIQATYTIEDNGPYDTDPTVGSVSDPVGIVSIPASTATAPNTGVKRGSYLPAIFTIIAGVSILSYEIYRNYRKAKAKSL